MQPHSLEVLSSHDKLWQQALSFIQKNRLPQAWLLIGPPATAPVQFANRLIAQIMCQQDNKPCKTCKSCYLFMNNIHPDIEYMRQDESDVSIKIDQVRELQQTIYHKPQQGEIRCVVIENAHKLSGFVANALLKILEEPPSHVVFILIADNNGTIPATIISRCQRLVFPLIFNTNYLDSQVLSLESPARLKLLTQKQVFSEQLCNLLQEKESPCTIAADWAQYRLEDVLWMLYLFAASMIRQQLIGSVGLESNTDDTLLRLSDSIDSIKLFKQIDLLHGFLRKLNQNIALNPVLILETWLIGILTALGLTQNPEVEAKFVFNEGV